jgi:Uma2 family endonuclease
MSVITSKSASVVRVPGVVTLRGVPYGIYAALRDERANDHLRMTYYDGTLEIMSPAYVHELPSRRIGVFMVVFCNELGIRYQGCGSPTFKRGVMEKKKGKGKEPDECFYFANAAKTLKFEHIDLDRDPPPDIWVEVDHRSSSAGRLPVYAELGVPEVWQLRAKSGRLRFLRLDAERRAYTQIERSLSLPMLTPELVLEGLALGRDLIEFDWVITLKAWVREKFLPPAE